MSDAPAVQMPNLVEDLQALKSYLENRQQKQKELSGPPQGSLSEAHARAQGLRDRSGVLIRRADQIEWVLVGINLAIDHIESGKTEPPGRIHFEPVGNRTPEQLYGEHVPTFISEEMPQLRYL